MQIAASVGIAAATLLFFYLLAKKLQKKNRKRSTKAGTVVLHQFPRYMSSVVMASPPCFKLETFLRMAKLPYENDYSMMYSEKGNCLGSSSTGKQSPTQISVFRFTFE